MGSPGTSLERLVAVRTFVSAVEAEIARTALEAAGIRALLRRDDCGGVRPSMWLAGVGLLVHASDLAAADTVLATPALYAAHEHSHPTGETEIVPSVYDFSVTTIDGARSSLDVYRGRVLLIVNVASQCGYTPQYAGLERLYRAHQAQGFIVLGFPCNQFGAQEPGTNDEIRAFCSERYDVTFPMFAKIDVNGDRADPLFRFLKAQRRGWLGSTAIRWNFTKFLVGRDGQVLRRFGTMSTPERIAPDIVRAVSVAA